MGVMTDGPFLRSQRGHVALFTLLVSCGAPSADTPSLDAVSRNEVVATTSSAPPAATVASDNDAQRTTPRDPCVIAAVSDGDSFRCRDDRRVRLLLLDAPEMDQAPFGVQARDALRARLRRGDTAWLEYDVRREDRYGRTLAHVYTAARGGTHVNLAQARDGWAVAVVFPPNVRDVERIRAAVAEARAAKRGLWANGAFTCEPIAHKRGDC
jgi:micrococcal nuclease